MVLEPILKAITIRLGNWESPAGVFWQLDLTARKSRLHISAGCGKRTASMRKDRLPASADTTVPANRCLCGPESDVCGHTANSKARFASGFNRLAKRSIYRLYPNPKAKIAARVGES